MSVTRLGQRRSRVAKGCLLALLSGFGTGCYVYPPVVTAPQPGTEIRLDLNDRGRAEVGRLAGPSATQILGVVQANTDTAYALKVMSVTYQNGQNSTWNGEPLVISKSFVANTTERKLSQSRTLLAAVGAVGAVVAFVATRGLLGSGNPDTDKGGGGGGNSFRWFSW